MKIINTNIPVKEDPSRIYYFTDNGNDTPWDITPETAATYHSIIGIGDATLSPEQQAMLSILQQDGEEGLME